MAGLEQSSSEGGCRIAVFMEAKYAFADSPLQATSSLPQEHWLLLVPIAMRVHVWTPVHAQRLGGQRWAMKDTPQVLQT
eukprot:CAMPEP_0172864254 /NCGR_PEP_ID=MMETSP1075-20121228/79699_1 /TAXON_ID=2916 /ORGANISM="Ceratium fusus, Strain PA161109" /LENGTH=78 /DNA_ID=CAMNT_0013713089 /DNA_START=538 /DNA_END=770 /DNA_ORIENTATION=+